MPVSEQASSPPTAPTPRSPPGPKTQEGKEISRRNSLRHGLAGDGVVVPEGLQQQLDAEVVGFRVRAASRATPSRIGWSTRRPRPASASSPRSRTTTAAPPAAAPRRWGPTTPPATAPSRRWRRRLKNEAGYVVPLLEATTEGCEYLLSGWDELAEALEEAGGWTSAQAYRR